MCHFCQRYQDHPGTIHTKDTCSYFGKEIRKSESSITADSIVSNLTQACTFEFIHFNSLVLVLHLRIYWKQTFWKAAMFGILGVLTLLTLSKMLKCKSIFFKINTAHAWINRLKKICLCPAKWSLKRKTKQASLHMCTNLLLLQT